MPEGGTDVIWKRIRNSRPWRGPWFYLLAGRVSAAEVLDFEVQHCFHGLTVIIQAWLNTRF